MDERFEYLYQFREGAYTIKKYHFKESCMWHHSYFTFWILFHVLLDPLLYQFIAFAWLCCFSQFSQLVPAGRKTPAYWSWLTTSKLFFSGPVLYTLQSKRFPSSVISRSRLVWRKNVKSKGTRFYPEHYMSLHDLLHHKKPFVSIYVFCL